MRRDAIPGAELLVLPEAAHVYPTDAPEADRRAAEFLLEQLGWPPAAETER